MHYYQFNIADYRKDTTHLKPMEHYIYRQLIDWYFLNEKPIPRNLKIVIRRLGIDYIKYLDMLESVLIDFFIEKDDGFHHKRIDEEITDYKDYLDKQSKNGKKGGRPAKIKTQKNPPLNLDNPNLTQKKPNQEPLTTNHKPKEKGVVAFADFYSRYPLKKSKIKAQQYWNKLTDKEKSLAINGISCYCDSVKDKTFLKHPSTYINQKIWTDETSSDNSSDIYGPWI